MGTLVYYLSRVAEYQWWHVAVELLLIGLVVYWAVDFLEGTRGERLFRGVLFILFAGLIILKLVGAKFGFERLEYLFQGFLIFVLILAVAGFQPEIRRLLAYLGSGKLTSIIMRGKVEFIEEILKSLNNIARRGDGALIVLEQETGLREYIETGVMINSEVSAELIETIFTPPSPLHDGAIILSGDRIVAAGCILPLTHNPMMSKVIGTRHRAAVGLSEVTDSIICIVSEETGEVSMAYEGSLKKGLELDEIKRILLNYYKEKVVAKSVKMEQ